MELHGPRLGDMIEVKFASFLQAATRCQADKGAASNQFTRHRSRRSTAHHSVHKFQVKQNPSFLSIVSFLCEFFLGNGAWVPGEHNSLELHSLQVATLWQEMIRVFFKFFPRTWKMFPDEFYREPAVNPSWVIHTEALTATIRNQISRKISTRLQALCGWGIRVFEQGNLGISSIRRLPTAKKRQDPTSRNILTKATGRLLTREWTPQVFGFQFRNQRFLSCGIRVIL